MKRLINNNGITLIALVITIIVLLILAGVTVAQLSGNGLFERTRIAKEKHRDAQEKEDAGISEYNNEIERYSAGLWGLSRDMVIKDLINQDDADYNKTKGGYIIPVASGWTSRNVQINLNENINNYAYVFITYDRCETGNYNCQKTDVIETNSFSSSFFVNSWGDGYVRFHMSKPSNSQLLIGASGGTGAGINSISEIRITKIIGIK